MAFHAAALMEARDSATRKWFRYGRAFSANLFPELSAVLCFDSRAVDREKKRARGSGLLCLSGLGHEVAVEDREPRHFGG